ncbi:MAG: 6-phosphofructokinase [Oscillospiraceae bacterium]|jgi:6-phosphofructokinase 1|nr:6-phosphofructokinase [Oscillospiraceae bacterium]
MAEKRTIGVLTSGGDAPGMNAAIRAVVRAAIKNGMGVKGVVRGYNGLIHNNFIDLAMRDVSDIIQRGGTMLGTARCKEFSTEEGVLLAAENCRKTGIEGLVVVGGDGSFRGARDLTNLGHINCVGIPGTIDNDIACTEYTIGYNTAMNTAMEMVDKLRDTSQSHDRCSVVEVMGRRAGYIALNAGIAVGASYIAVPERKFDMDEMLGKIQAAHSMGKQHFIIVVAEGVAMDIEGGCETIAKRIEEVTGIETRATVLGHVQRGGNPTVIDRVAATTMGHYAVQLLTQGIGSRVVGQQQGRVVDFDINEALQMKKKMDMSLYTVADDVSF